MHCGALGIVRVPKCERHARGRGASVPRVGATFARQVFGVVPEKWVELHAEELQANWELAMDEKPLNPIPPLR